MTAIFIAGTDTEIGKTFVTCALLHAARAQGRVAVGMKPIAAGADLVAGELLNEDAARLRAAGSFDPGLALLNPYCLKSPIAPHIAAAEEGVTIEPAPILAAFDEDNEPDLSVPAPDEPLSVDRLEWEHIQRVLTENDGNISATARALKMHRRTLQRKLAKRPVKA